MMNSPEFPGDGLNAMPVQAGQTITNAMTIDVEDYVHVSAFAHVIRISDWDRHESRVERNTRRLLELFGEHGVKGTFFVLGWVAQRHPAIIREIAAHGHEIACHGLTHQLVYNQTPEVFREETHAAKALLEDIAQQPVLGYRAASYSITARSLWALDILVDLGFRYDSSIFPVRHDRYGISGARVEPYLHATPSGHTIVEFPLTTKDLLRYRLPIAGGGYFRLFPYALTRSAFRSINRRERRPFIFYLHPWEIDPDQPRIRAGWLSMFRHYNNLDKCEARLAELLRDFRFGTVQEVLTGLGLLG
jgi:polysaccharide deacetylase family protein (PEP-CTERM system associated)